MLIYSDFGTILSCDGKIVSHKSHAASQFFIDALSYLELGIYQSFPSLANGRIPIETSAAAD